MKNLILALVFTAALTFGVGSINASEFTSNTVNTESHSIAEIEIRVYEDGAIWVYVYSTDGSFITKYLDNE